MRNFKIKVYFEKGKISQHEIKLIQNDYNSTEFEFEFDIQDGKKVFELKKPDGTPFIKDIVNNKIVLVDFDDEGNIIPIINQAGPYKFEIVCYTENSKITTEPGYFEALDEVVDLDEDKLSENVKIPLLDSLINETIEASNNSKEQGDYAKKQGDYAKEQAQKVIDSNSEAKEIINTFESNVDNYTNDFNKNADSKLKSYNQNDTTKTNSYNENASSKLKEYNDNHEEKITDYNTNHTNKLKAYDNNDIEKVEAYNSNHDSKLSDYNINAETKLTEYNSNHDSKMEIYNSNHTTKMQEYNSNTEMKVNEFNEEIETLKDELNDCYNNQLIGQASGTSIYVDDSADARMRVLEIDGTLEQETTKGINLLKCVKTESETINGVTFTPVYKNGSLQYINVNGTSTENTNYYMSTDTYAHNQMLTTGTYTLSDGKIEESSTTYFTFMDVELSPDYNLSTAGIKTMTLPQDSKIKSRIVVRSGITLNNVKFYPMLEKGTEASPYEPYTGGQASPNPDYPQEIEVLEAPNLLPYPYTETTKTVNGITFTDNGDGTITLNGTATNEANFKLYGSNNINNQLPILGKYISGGISNNIKIKVINKDTNGYTILSTSSGNQEEIDLSVYKNGYIEILVNKNTICNNVVLKPMLTKTNKIKNYIPYGCIETKVLSGNLYNYQDIDLQEPASAISVDEDGWVTLTYDNSDGESTKYVNYWVKKNNFLKTDTQYNLILEIKKVSGTGRLVSISTATGHTGQFLTSVGYNFSNLLSGNIYKNLITTRDSFNDSSTITRSFVQFLPGESGTITFRISILKDTTVTPTQFKYTPYQEETVDINLQGNFMAKITDDIKDKLKIENGHAILSKKVGKLVLNDIKSYIFKSATNAIDRFGIPKSVFNNLNVKEINENNSKCTHFRYLIEDKIGTYKTLTEAKQAYFDFAKSGTTTIDEFKSWLEENNVELYFELEEPYEVDLGPVKLPKNFKGVSNIFLNANLETNMKVEYVKDTQLVIDNLQSQIDNINTLLSTTNTSALLLDNLQSDLESEVI